MVGLDWSDSSLDLPRAAACSFLSAKYANDKPGFISLQIFSLSQSPLSRKFSGHGFCKVDFPGSVSLCENEQSSESTGWQQALASSNEHSSIECWCSHRTVEGFDVVQSVEIDVAGENEIDVIQLFVRFDLIAVEENISLSDHPLQGKDCRKNDLRDDHGNKLIAKPIRIRYRWATLVEHKLLTIDQERSLTPLTTRCRLKWTFR